MLRRACCLILALTLALGVWPASPARASVTLEEERKIGREAYDEVMAQMPMVEDPDCVEYVRNLGRRLVGQLRDNPFSYTFHIADSPEMNAFALPAGYIFMFRGMMTNLDSEAELAGILGHEISHVSYRHLANRMDKTAPLNMAMMAGMLAGILLGAAGGAPQLGQALAVGWDGRGPVSESEALRAANDDLARRVAVAAGTLPGVGWLRPQGWAGRFQGGGLEVAEVSGEQLVLRVRDAADQQRGRVGLPLPAGQAPAQVLEQALSELAQGRGPLAGPLRSLGLAAKP